VQDHVRTREAAEERFAGIVNDYMLAWAAETDGDSEQFVQLLVHIQESVASEAVALWQATGWHAGWFERACRRKVDDALGARVKIWKSLARKYEIQHIENSHISLLSIVKAGGDLKIAFELDQGQKVLNSMRTYLEPGPPTTEPTRSPERSTPVETTPGENGEISAASLVPKTVDVGEYGKPVEEPKSPHPSPSVL
jgi:hypothetical protein